MTYFENVSGIPWTAALHTTTEEVSLHLGLQVPSQDSLLVQGISIILLSGCCLLFNVMLIMTIKVTSELQTISNMFILNLAITDVLLAALVLPAWATTTLTVDTPFGYNTCQAAGLITILLFLESISTLAGIAADRYICICHPLKYPLYMTNAKARAFVVYSWFQSLVIALLPLFHFGRYGFRTTYLPICSVDFAENVYYTIVVLCCTILPSCLVICFSYINIFKAARYQMRKVSDIQVTRQTFHNDTLAGSSLIQQLYNANVEPSASNSKKPISMGSSLIQQMYKTESQSEPGNTDNTEDQPDSSGTEIQRIPSSLFRAVQAFQEGAGASKRGSILSTISAANSIGLPGYLYNGNDQQQSQLWRRAMKSIGHYVKQVRSMKTVLMIIGCFMACWLPYIILIIYTVANHENPPNYMVDFVITFLAFSNSLANPIICVCINREFRVAVKKTFGCYRREMMRRVVAVFTAASMAPFGREVRVESSASQNSSEVVKINASRYS